MFVSATHIISLLGMSTLLQFASGRIEPDYDNRLTADDINAALLGEPVGENQMQIASWFNAAAANVNAVIMGYVAKFELTELQINSSPLPSIATDLMWYELSNNPGDELLARKKAALQMLDKINAGTIQIKKPLPKSHGTMRTAKPTSNFDWCRF
ncbi:phage protein Gp36 family protein [Pseudoalteromonas piscicida]|uniref:phage protein Gp36 family protein n=1 Tax=Pseudoalteromonas piscicida TaxID=43662 RepID=UPI0030C9D791